MWIKRPKVEELIETQIKSWFSSFRRQEAKRKWRPPILISRQRESLGEKVAELLSERLNWPLYDKELLEEVSKTLKEDPKKLQAFDEKARNLLLEFAQAFLGSRSLLQEEYVHHLKRFVKWLGVTGNCVVVGRGANFVIDPARALRIRIIGRPKGWEKAFSEAFGIKEEEAEIKAKEMNEEQEEFIKRYFDADVSDPSHYDLVINMDHYDWQKASEMVLTAYKLKFPWVNITG